MRTNNTILKSISLVSLLVLSVQTSKAISVWVEMWQWSFCFQNTGALRATVNGGMPPYRYDWYRMDSGTPVLVCSDCTDIYGGVNDTPHKVVVTDANMETAEGFGNVEVCVIGVWNAGTYAYLAGESPVVWLLSQTPCSELDDRLEFLEPIQLGPVSVDRSTGIAKDLPPGTSSYLCSSSTSYPGCGSGTHEGFVGLPVDLPSVAPLQILPSCTNGLNGKIEFALLNGVIRSDSKLWAVLKSSAGAELQRLQFDWSVMNTANPTLIRQFTGLAPGDYRLIITGKPQTGPWTTTSGFVYTCRDSIPITIPTTGVTCGQVQGTVFIDANSNCAPASNEAKVPGVLLEVLPGPVYTSTNSAGFFDLRLVPGAYTVRELGPQIDQSCSSGPIPFTVPASITPVIVNVPCSSAVALDVEMRLSSGAARTGFALTYSALIRNRTPATSGAITVTMQLDPALVYVSATPTPTSVVGNLLTWNQTTLTVYQERSILVNTTVPADIGVFGTGLTTTATVSSANVDGDLSNNTSVLGQVVTGSYDPNDKLAQSSSGSNTQYDPAQDEWIDYTVRFQNTGTDTAFTVIITDALPSTLDPASLDVGVGSHPFTWSLRGTNELRFHFPNIQLPHTAVNEPGSHGFVSFRIKPKLPLPAGTQISNAANIYFDFNPPVITDPAVLTFPVPPVLVRPRVLLGGAYSATTPPLSDALRVLGKVPYREPYTSLGYAHSGNGGGELASPAAMLITGNNAIVDWVIVELRNNAGSVVASRSCLLQRDGDVVASNGTSAIAFAVPSGNYKVVIRHRNHLGVMTSANVALSTTAATIDFTNPTTATYGTNARQNVSGVMVLWPGDGTADGVVKYTGSFNDRDPILVAIGGSVATNTVNNVYNRLDINMNGTISYTGLGNDRDMILQTIGGSVASATRVQQLP